MVGFEVEDDFQAGIVVGERDLCAVQVCDGGDDGEAQAAAGRIAAGLKAIESLEDVLALLLRNSPPAIGDLRDRGAFLLLQ